MHALHASSAPFSSTFRFILPKASMLAPCCPRHVPALPACVCAQGVAMCHGINGISGNAYTLLAAADALEHGAAGRTAARHAILQPTARQLGRQCHGRRRWRPRRVWMRRVRWSRAAQQWQELYDVPDLYLRPASLYEVGLGSWTRLVWCGGVCGRGGGGKMSMVCICACTEGRVGA